jgi:hypothetical protein
LKTDFTPYQIPTMSAPFHPTDSAPTSSKPADDSDEEIPLPVLKLTRSLSHQDKAIEAAQLFFDRCQEGDTVLANFFTDHLGNTNLEYYQKENGVMVLHQIDAPRKEIKLKFTYEATFFPF